MTETPSKTKRPTKANQVAVIDLANCGIPNYPSSYTAAVTDLESLMNRMYLKGYVYGGCLRRSVQGIDREYLIFNPK